MWTLLVLGRKTHSYTAAFLLALIAAGAAPAAAAPTVDEAVQAVENHYRELVDLTAKVVQKNHLKALDKTQTFDAALWIRKPGRLRLDYSNGQVILVDGKAALFYSRKSEQVIKKTFSDIEQMNIPVAFLLGAAHIRDDFEVRLPDPADPLLLELSPKKPGAAMKKLILRSDAAGRIASLDILDKAGNRTEIIFSGMQEGADFDDKPLCSETTGDGDHRTVTTGEEERSQESEEAVILILILTLILR
jgi:outer membrane lipoprotein-sorting protein